MFAAKAFRRVHSDAQEHRHSCDGDGDADEAAAPCLDNELRDSAADVAQRTLAAGRIGNAENRTRTCRSRAWLALIHYRGRIRQIRDCSRSREVLHRVMLPAATEARQQLCRIRTGRIWKDWPWKCGHAIGKLSRRKGDVEVVSVDSAPNQHIIPRVMPTNRSSIKTSTLDCM